MFAFQNPQGETLGILQGELPGVFLSSAGIEPLSRAGDLSLLIEAMAIKAVFRLKSGLKPL